MNSFSKNATRGQSVFSAVLIIALVLELQALTFSLDIWQPFMLLIKTEEEKQLGYNAESCIEMSYLKYLGDEAYHGNETLIFQEYTCQVEPYILGPETLTITAKAISDNRSVKTKKIYSLEKI